MTIRARLYTATVVAVAALALTVGVVRPRGKTPTACSRGTVPHFLRLGVPGDS